MKILKYKKKSKDKYELLLDDNTKFEIYEDVILKNNLLMNKNIDINILEKIKKDNDESESYNKCINYISYRIRSEKEIKEYLKKNNFDNKLIINTIDKLKNNNMINDEIFTKSFINDKLLMTNYGPYKIKNELLKHNIDDNIIDKYINVIDKEVLFDKTKKIIDKIAKSNKKLSKKMLINKINNSLILLGYEKKLYIDYLNRIDVDNNDVLEREFHKLYNKMSCKYNGSELKIKIKQKLYQKGFSICEIDILIDKNIQ